MKAKQVVIGATVVYVGNGQVRWFLSRSRVLEVHRFNERERDIGPLTLPALVLKNEAVLKRHGGLKPADRLAVAQLDAEGHPTSTVHLYAAHEMEFV